MDGFLAILRREVLVGGRKRSFYVIRSLGLGAIGTLSLAQLLAFRSGIYGNLGSPDIYGNIFLSVFASTQVLILLPCSILQGAYGIGQEKERRTLDILLCSGIRPIAVLGGLALGRWIPLAVALVGSLPIGMIFLGIADLPLTRALLVYVMFLGMSALLVGLSSFLAAVLSRAATAAAAAAMIAIGPMMLFPSIVSLFASGTWIEDVVNWFSPFASIGNLAEGRSLLLPSAQALSWSLLGVVLVLAGARAVERAREGTSSIRTRKPPRGKTRPPSGNPVLWLQRQRHPIPLWQWIGAGTFAVATYVVSRATLGGMDQFMVFYLFEWGVFTILWILAILFAASSLSGQLNRDILSTVLASPIVGRSIILGAGAGILWRLLPSLLAYISIFLSFHFLPLKSLAGPFGTMETAYVLLTAGKGLSSILLTVTVGLYMSLWTRSTVRAAIWTLGIGIGLSLGAYLFPLLGGAVSFEAWYGWRMLGDVIISALLLTRLFLTFDRLVGRSP